MEMSDCVFCDILSGQLPSSIVYRDDRCTAFMDIQPVNSGHLLVVPNLHAASLAHVEDHLAVHIFRVAKHLATALRNSGIKCEGVNLFLADGEAAGQEVFHVHLHVFPRFQGDGFGFKSHPSYSQKPGRAELEADARRIRKALAAAEKTQSRTKI